MIAIHEQLQGIFQLQDAQAENIVALIDAGNTIPFIARYRKEITGNMDDQALRRFSQELIRLRSLAARREEVCRLIDNQGRLTESLRDAVMQAATLAEIDDIYRPYRPKRKTRGSTARERGLQPLADSLLDPGTSLAAVYLQAGIMAEASAELADASAALAGALDILAEQLSDQARLRRTLRQLLFREGMITSKLVSGADISQSVFAMYADYQEPLNRIRSHRILALNRGEREKQLNVSLRLEQGRAVEQVLLFLPRKPEEKKELFLRLAEDAWKRLIFPSLSTEIRKFLTEKAEDGAMEVFAENLRSLLMQPPIRGRTVMGLDPGFRTGCKVAVVDPTGRVLDTGVIYPTPPHNRVDAAASMLQRLIRQYQVNLMALGNGTASRETERFIAQRVNQDGPAVPYLLVSEAGASVYSASPEAAAEFPDYDVSLRSAVSIARRVQDPLAELVKIEPRSIGVGQYQHDMQEKRLDERLTGVVEDCVNQVGVDLNTASAALLRYVAGLQTGTAEQIVRYRETNGVFPSRQALLQVPRLGPKAFEQCAGFLRIPGAVEMLDNTSVHPESYDHVRKLARMLDCPPSPELARAARGLPTQQLAHNLGIGQPTLQDILAALMQPGRDPRDDLPQPDLRSDVMEISDLKPGMILQGVVRNVADFGAFVDIGVHQDGLVHVSELADHYVQRPMDIVQTGQPVRVTVLDVDLARKRIALSMKRNRQEQKGSGQDGKKRDI